MQSEVHYYLGGGGVLISHSDEYEDFCILEGDTVYSGTSSPVIRRNVQLLSSR
jgi:hypothetical protein